MLPAKHARVPNPPVSSRLVSFTGGGFGAWRVNRVHGICGEPLPICNRLNVGVGEADARGSGDVAWRLSGAISNERYVERAEKDALVATQQGLGRSTSTCAALIPIRKNAAWWALTQDERRRVFEAQSQHIAIGMTFLPAIARRLHHCRDLGTEAPFDFLTWFEYAPADGPAFDALLVLLRASAEWSFVDREVEIRLTRSEP